MLIHRNIVLGLISVACTLAAYSYSQAEQPNHTQKGNFKFDRFGQLHSATWPQKVHSVQELQNDAKAEVAYYDSLKLPPRDLYGGYPGTKEKLGFKSTGFFHVERANSRFYLVTPEGNAFFSIAAGGLFSYHDWLPMQDESRTLFEWTPVPDSQYAVAFFGDHKEYFSFYVANWIRKYGRYNSLEWKKTMALRLKKWGFNTHNAYGRYAQISETAKLPMTIVLRVNGEKVIPCVNLFDVYDPEARRCVNENMAKAVSPYAAIPWIVGYYLDNEPKFYEFKNEIMKLDDTWAVKRALIVWLQKKYETVSKLNKAWGINVKNFKELLPSYTKKINKRAGWDLQAFRAVFLDRYFKFMQQTFHKHDPNHLILGYRFRWKDSRDRSLNKAVAPYVDVISDNYYGVKEFDKTFLMNAYQVSEKPRILSEWSYDAADCGLPGQIRHVATQAIRGIGYRQYQEQAASLPFVVGTQWWCIQDHQKGLVNTGLINVTDRPYKTFLTYVRQANLDVENIILDGQAPFASSLSQVGLRDHEKDYGWTNWRDLRAEYTNFAKDNQADHPEIQQK